MPQAGSKTRDYYNIMNHKAQENILELLAKAQNQQRDMLDKLRDRSSDAGDNISPLEVDIVPVSEAPQFSASEESGVSHDWIAFLRLLLELQPPRDPLSHLASLQQAAEQNWLLSTTEVEKLIGTKPRSTKKIPVFVRGSFSFTPAGKIGNMKAWKVGKVDSADRSL